MSDFAGCPAREAFRPFSPDYLVDPYPTFAHVREESPAFYSEELDMWVVTRYDDGGRVMSDTERLSSRNAQDALLPFGAEAAAVLHRVGRLGPDQDGVGVRFLRRVQGASPRR